MLFNVFHSPTTVVIDSHSLMMGAGAQTWSSDIFDMLFPFLAFAKLYPIILWKIGDGFAAKGLLDVQLVGGCCRGGVGVGTSLPIFPSSHQLHLQIFLCLNPPQLPNPRWWPNMIMLCIQQGPLYHACKLLL